MVIGRRDPKPGKNADIGPLAWGFCGVAVFWNGGPTQVSNGDTDPSLSHSKLVVVAPEHIQLLPMINKLLQLEPQDLSLLEGIVRLMLDKKLP